VTTGMNIQVTATVAGTLVHVSDPLPGSVHDLTALRTHQLLDGRTADQWIADKGYQGSGMLTPHKKPIGGELCDDHKAINTVINSHRAVIERVIAQLKTWRILHTDYRRPIDTFPETIATVIALHFYTLNP
jgi:transposase